MLSWLSGAFYLDSIEFLTLNLLMSFAIKTYSPQDQFIKAVIYGASGSGKTTFAVTAPKPIFASSEKGLMSIRQHKPAYAEINSLKDLQDMLAYLQTPWHGYETVIIDSITEINDIIKSEIEKRNKRNMQLADWGELSKQIKVIFRGFRDLPMHVIFIAQETTEKDEDKITKILPSLNGKAATEIAYYMDTVAYAYIDKAGVRKVITAPHNLYLTKDRTNVIQGGENQSFSDWVKEMKKEVKTGKEKTLFEQKDTPPAPTNESTTTPSNEGTPPAKVAWDPASEEQIKTFSDMILAIAWDIPFPEVLKKAVATIKAKTARTLTGDTLEELALNLTKNEARTVIAYLRPKYDEALKKSIPEILYKMDGDKVCATFTDFVNLQESPVWFGDNEEEAKKNLIEESEAKKRIEKAIA